MEYIILNSDNIKGLADSVNVYMANGWKPAGGVTFCRMNHPHMAMIRETSPETPTVAKKTKEAKAK